jgi:hypothetical protein
MNEWEGKINRALINKLGTSSTTFTMLVCLVRKPFIISKKRFEPSMASRPCNCIYISNNEWEAKEVNIIFIASISYLDFFHEVIRLDRRLETLKNLTKFTVILYQLLDPRRNSTHVTPTVFFSAEEERLHNVFPPSEKCWGKYNLT